MSETIFSLSTGSLPSGVAIIRISGPQVRFAIETICDKVPGARAATYSAFRDNSNQIIDRGLVLYFPGPHSFTGEDCGEFHLHGSRAVVAAMLTLLSGVPGLRQAEAGEFTRQAFANGKMDLTEVEGLSDLLIAETEAQRRAAIDQVGGALRALYHGWMGRLTHARAMLEAEFDFSDEEDIPGSVSDRIWPDLENLSEEISRHIDGLHWGEVVRDGFRVSLVGAPNTGKSTLLNRLADRDIAIVSAQPGTTRDTIETRLDVDGYLVILRDTAGLRDTLNEIEQEGIRRTLAAAQTSDLVLFLDDGSGTGVNQPLLEGISLDDISVVSVRTKIDLNNNINRLNHDIIYVSAMTGAGIDGLIARIKQEILLVKPIASLAPNRPRHRSLLLECQHHIRRALSIRIDGVELSAAELRSAANSLGNITGHVGVEDLLGVIFSEFCVGK